MANIERGAKAPKLSVTLKGADDKSLGTRTLSNCNPDATLDGFLKAGGAITVLCGAMRSDIKKVNTYVLVKG